MSHWQQHQLINSTKQGSRQTQDYAADYDIPYALWPRCYGKVGLVIKYKQE
jgi:hypothetical protein